MKKPNTTKTSTPAQRDPDRGFSYSRSFFEGLVDSALAHAKKLGADEVILYKTKNFAEEIKKRFE